MEFDGIGVTAKKDDNFSEWYSQVILRAELADYAPVKGCMVIRPLGFDIWESIRNTFDAKIKRTGHKNTYFPMLVPERLLEKEAEHFEGFIPEVAWVTRGGNSDLSEKLALRPTSETIMYNMYAKWIRSWRDLPLLLNQWVNVIRWETKATKLFLRTREFLWQEGHTVHETSEEAENEVMTILDDYRDILEGLLAIPVIPGRKSESERFAGAKETMTLEALMPDGKALQAATSHNLGQGFSRAFGITYIDREGENQNPWQTCWGISTRLIGGVVMVHGDDKGLVLPPKVSPVQVMVVPITFQKNKEEVISAARSVIERLEARFRAELDDRDDRTPGYKFNEWELKGVPVRVEIGPRDLKNSQVVLVRRDTGEKLPVPMDGVEDAIADLLEQIQKDLFAKAKEFLDSNTSRVSSYTEFKDVLDGKGGLIIAAWCGSAECEETIHQETGATIRLIPLERDGKTPSSECICCGEEAKETVYFAKAY